MTSSLRSVFQTYAPSLSATSPTASLPRSSPRITADAFAAGVRKPSSPVSEEPEGSRPIASRTLSGSTQPTVAPQMIKRYSSTFSYRQARTYASGASVDSTSGDADATYSRSWQSRIEARQNYAAQYGSSTGSAFRPGSIGRGESSLSAARMSPRIDRRRVSTTLHIFVGTPADSLAEQRLGQPRR